MPNYNSDEYADQVAVPPEMLQPNQAHGRVRIAHFSFGAASGNALTVIANDTLNFAKMPAGDVRLLRLCAKRSAFAAGATLDVGIGAYTNQSGVAVVADPDALVANLALDATTDIDLLLDIRIQSKTQFDITGLVETAGGTSEELNGWFEYVVD